MVQTAGLEPATFWTATRRSNPLSYACNHLSNNALVPTCQYSNTQIRSSLGVECFALLDYVLVNFLIIICNHRMNITHQSIVLVLGDQLFYNESLSEEKYYVMIESRSLCTRFRFHKFKLAYLLTCMREYRDALLSLGKTVDYYDIDQNTDFETILKNYAKQGLKTIKLYTIANKPFEIYLQGICNQLGICLDYNENPMFLTPPSIAQSYLTSKKSNSTQSKLLLNDFYIFQRKRLSILVDDDNQPMGGKWSFDKNNRKKLPPSIELPQQPTFYSRHYDTVCTLVDRYFGTHSGLLPSQSYLPFCSIDAQKYFETYLHSHFALFGDYQDSMTYKHNFVFHSVISPLLNYGLLTPNYVINQAIQSEVPINSLEGFIRQIVGWREWMKVLYDNVYDTNLEKYNYFDSNMSLPDYFYSINDTNIDQIQSNTPLFQTLTKVHSCAYAHHIERLMIVSNWCLLNEYRPLEVYKWFMEMFVDSTEWVMVGNVIGMGLYADGGLFATKPYISGGNYIKKMSDYTELSTEWEQIWTNLFWSFLLKHQEKLKNNPRLAMLITSKTKS